MYKSILIFISCVILLSVSSTLIAQKPSAPTLMKNATTNDLEVFRANSNGNIVKYWRKSYRQWLGPTVLFGENIASAPAFIKDQVTGYEVAAATTKSGKIAVFYKKPQSGWVGPIVTLGKPEHRLVSAPALIQSKVTGVIYLVATDIYGYMESYARDTNLQWIGAQQIFAKGTTSAPSLVQSVKTDKIIQLFATDKNGHIHSYTKIISNIGNPWSGPQEEFGQNIAFAPSVIKTGSLVHKSLHLIATDKNGQLETFYQLTGEKWTGPTWILGKDIASAPSLIADRYNLEVVANNKNCQIEHFHKQSRSFWSKPTVFGKPCT